MLIAEVILGERLTPALCEAFEWDVRTKYTVHVRYQEKRSAICFLLFPKALQVLRHFP